MRLLLLKIRNNRNYIYSRNKSVRKLYVYYLFNFLSFHFFIFHFTTVIYLA